MSESPFSDALDDEISAAAVGHRVWFSSEKRPYKIRARNGRYLICTKPFNAKKTVIYTVIDLEEKVRGTDNLVFSFGYETDEEISENMRMFDSGEIEVSHRNRVALDITRIAP